uniref:Uncharacterized protein n=1 Tax=Tanacetum cinerariifolium TaxID=118510 RepID=A0A699WBJ6_TANCI|nr:hypothetical protein [Tanacetum cinerariifolium]
MLFHMVMTDMKLLVVETETADITDDDVDTVFCSTDVGRSKQVDLKSHEESRPSDIQTCQRHRTVCVPSLVLLMTSLA